MASLAATQLSGGGALGNLIGRVCWHAGHVGPILRIGSLGAVTRIRCGRGGIWPAVRVRRAAAFNKGTLKVMASSSRSDAASGRRIAAGSGSEELEQEPITTMSFIRPGFDEPRR